MDIIAIIPARAGSKRIPNKNIQLLNGKPLLAYTVEAAIDSGVAKEVFVSTDSEKIAEVARNFGAEVIKRPAEISHDAASTESVVIHALEIIRKERCRMPNAILTLPPTSPLRSFKTIRNFVSYYLNVAEQYDAMVSLNETRGDYWIKDSKGNFRRLFPAAPRRSQDREPIYLENSAIYITKTEAILNTNSILGNNCTGFIINNIESLDINEPLDLQWAEFVLQNMAIAFMSKEGNCRLWPA